LISNSNKNLYLHGLCEGLVRAIFFWIGILDFALQNALTLDRQLAWSSSTSISGQIECMSPLSDSPSKPCSRPGPAASRQPWRRHTPASSSTGDSHQPSKGPASLWQSGCVNIQLLAKEVSTMYLVAAIALCIGALFLLIPIREIRRGWQQPHGRNGGIALFSSEGAVFPSDGGSGSCDGGHGDGGGCISSGHGC